MESTLSTLACKTQKAKTFTMFSELPPELRIKVWQLAMPEARTVVVRSPYTRKTAIPKSLEESLAQQWDSSEAWRSNTQIPALLHVNAEARHEALKHYKLSLGVGQHPPRVYVDFTRDTLFFGNSELKSECSSLWASTKDVDQFQRLAVVPEGAWRILRWQKVDLSSLQKIIFVHNTEKLKLGPSPQLVEDEAQDEIEELAERIEEAQQQQASTSQAEDAMKKRMQEAREELDTLLQVLPTQCEKEPVVSTAVFKKSPGDRWTSIACC
ncbi:hypothetical protein BJ170DRAFT_687625 [Xylariales sp. AK1849]|nr:hypothetical protein BJ170DRAFT_687625 [Xylariales sp. AK1849]